MTAEASTGIVIQHCMGWGSVGGEKESSDEKNYVYLVVVTFSTLSMF